MAHRLLDPYLHLFDALLGGSLSVRDFELLLIDQYHAKDMHVDWEAEWSTAVEEALADVHTACELHIPNAPEDSHVSEAELISDVKDAREILLRAVQGTPPATSP